MKKNYISPAIETSEIKPIGVMMTSPETDPESQLKPGFNHAPKKIF